MQKASSAERAVFINKALDDAGLPTWGRAGLVKKRMNVSPATASGWLTGTLPKDPAELFRFASEFNFDAHEWVYLEKAHEGAGLGGNRVEELIKKLKNYEIGTQKNLTADQFSKLFMLLLRNEEKATFLLDNAEIFE